MLGMNLFIMSDLIKWPKIKAVNVFGNVIVIVYK